MTNKLNNPFKITELINTINELDTDKQDTLISGTNIKTINGSSVLGSGDLTVTADTNDCVHKTGNETIGGRKTYTESYVHKNFDLTKGTLPTSANWWSNEYTDKNGSGLNNRLACMEYSISTNGDATTYLRTYKYASNNSDSATLSIVYPITGNPYAICPASDINSSIVTTVNKSKAENGYFQLGNGLIIQWGSYTYGDGSTHTITFPKAFSSTNYSISFGHQLKESNTCDFYGPQITNGTKNTTSCSVFARNANTARSANVTWIAVGY